MITDFRPVVLPNWGVAGGELSELSTCSCVRFSHHAKNKMRQYKLTRDDVLGIVVEGDRSGEDENGNLFHIKQVRGTFYLAVVALDDGSLITIYDLRK